MLRSSSLPLAAVLALLPVSAGRGQVPPATDTRLSAPLDRQGDPLPAGAVARLGTVRLRHGGAVRCLSFSAAGKTLASAADEAVRLWDAPTGKEILRLGRGAQTVAFAPTGRFLATGGFEGKVRLWEAASGREVLQFGQVGDIYTIAFSPDGETLASGGREGMVSLDDVATGKHLHDWHVPGRLASIAFSPKGGLLASATTGNLVQVWHLATRTELPQFRGRKLPGYHVAFSPDGRLLAAGSTSGGVILWEASSGKEVRRIEQGGGEVTFSPDGRHVAIADGQAVRLWEVATGKPVAALPWPHQYTTSCIRYSADGKYLAVGGGGCPAISVWELATRKEVSAFPGHRQPVRAVAFSPDRRVLVSVAAPHDGAQATVCFWQLATGKALHRLEAPAGRDLSIFFAHTGRAVSVGPGYDGTVRRWSASTAGELPFIPGRPGRPAHSLAVSADRKTLAVGSSDNTVRIYDARSGQALRQLDIAPPEAAVLALSPDGTLLACGDRDGTVRLVATASGKALRQCRQAALMALAFSPDGRILAAAGTGPIHLWEVATGRELPGLRRHEDLGQTTCVAFSPDGRTLASAGYDGMVRVWELVARRERHVFQIGKWVTCVAFSDDGAVLASGSMDTSVLVWDLTDSLRERRPGDTLEAGELSALWADLAGADGRKAHQAIWRLARNPRQAVPFLGSRLRPAPPVDHKRIAMLIADLGSEHFAARARASRELASLGELAEPALRSTLADRPSLEVRRRVQQLLQRLDDGTTPPDQLRLLRAVEALEHLDGPEAQDVLAMLARGAPEARLTQEARASLDRRDRRTTKPAVP
jgi:WD40 repeat protein